MESEPGTLLHLKTHAHTQWTQAAEKIFEKKVREMDYNIFNEQRLERRFCDALITVEGAEFHAHKIILCGCSTYFRSLFTSAFPPQNQHIYSIPGVSADIMELIIKYAYVQDITIAEENACELLIAADYLGVTDLVNKCCKTLKAQLSPETCISIWHLSDIYFLEKLKQQAFQMILRNFEEIFRISDEFLDLTVEKLSEIIRHDNLSIKHEKMVFEAILKWTSHSPHERKAQIGVLMPMVRMGLLKRDFLLEMRNNPFVTSNEASMQIIRSALMSTYSSNPAKHLRPNFTPPRLPKAIMLAMGGFKIDSTNVIEAYDSRTDSWVPVKSKHGASGFFHGTVLANGFVYCIAGHNGEYNQCYVNKFDPVSRIWTTVKPLCSYRFEPSVCALDGQIYAIGGCNGYEILNTVERYNPEADQWSMIAPMIQRRSNSSAAGLNGKVYVCGGVNREETLCSVEYYSPQMGHWVLIPNMNSRRSGLGVTAYGGELYAVGGLDKDVYLKSAEVYNPQTNSWRNIPDMHTERMNFGIEVMDDRLFVVGGVNLNRINREVEYYSRKPAKWCAVKSMSLYRCGVSCCVLSGLPNMADYIAPQDDLYRVHNISPSEQVVYTKSCYF